MKYIKPKKMVPKKKAFVLLLKINTQITLKDYFPSEDLKESSIETIKEEFHEGKKVQKKPEFF